METLIKILWCHVIFPPLESVSVCVGTIVKEILWRGKENEHFKPDFGAKK